MSSKRHGDQVVQLLTDHGYEWDRRNSKQLDVYVCDGHREYLINPCMPEAVARKVMRSIQREFGESAQSTKRRPDQVRAREAAVREQAAEQVARLERERAEIIARRDGELDGQGARLTRREARAIERRLNEIERDRRELRALMTQTPTSGDHGGTRRAQHQTGAR